MEDPLAGAAVDDEEGAFPGTPATLPGAEAAPVAEEKEEAEASKPKGEEVDEDGAVDGELLKAAHAQDDLQNQLKRMFGFDGGARGLVQFDMTDLNKFLGEVGEKLQQHDTMLVSPPWLTHLQKQQRVLETQVADLTRELKAMREGHAPARRVPHLVDPDDDATDRVGELERELAALKEEPPTTMTPPPPPTRAKTDEERQGTSSSSAAAAASAAPAPAPAGDDDPEDPHHPSAPAPAAGTAVVEDGPASMVFRMMATRGEVKALERKLKLEYVGFEELEDRLVALHDSVVRVDEVAKLDVRAQLVCFSVELARLKKTVEVAPSAREMEALKEMYGGKLKALRLFCTEKVMNMEQKAKRDASFNVDELRKHTNRFEKRHDEELKKLRVLVTRLQEVVADQRLASEERDAALGRRVDEVGAQAVRGLAEQAEQHQVASTRMEETRAFAEALESRHSAMASEHSTAADLIARNREKAEAMIQDVATDVDAVRQRLEATLTKVKSLKEETVEQDSRLDGVEVLMKASAKKVATNAKKIAEVDGKAQQNAGVALLRDQDLKLVTASLEQTKTNTTVAMETCHVEIKFLKAKLDAAMARTEDVEQEITLAIHPKVADLATNLTLLREAAQRAAADQATWNEAMTKSAAAATEKSREVCAGHAARLEGHAADLANLDASLESAHGNQRIASDRAKMVESTISSNHDKISTAVEDLKRDAEARFDRGEQQLPFEIGKLRAHVKELFDSMDTDITSKIKFTHHSQIHLAAEDQKIHLRNKARALAKCSLTYEQLATEKGRAPNGIPRDLCRTISLVTHEMAEYVAHKADAWAMEQFIHGEAPSSPEDAFSNNSYSDATVEHRRQRITQNFMELVMEEITRHHANAGAIRLEARHKTLTKIFASIEMALTKMDVVTVVGNSRLLARRIDPAIPKCVTCDRALVNAKNPYKEAYALPPSTVVEHLSRPESSAAFPPRLADLGFRASTASSSMATADYTSHLMMMRESASATSLYSRQLADQKDKLLRLTVKAGTSAHQRAKSPAVLRAGFRMPSTTPLSPAIAAMMQPNVIEANRAAQFERNLDETDPTLDHLSRSLPNLSAANSVTR